jgi:hypothetical protein
LGVLPYHHLFQADALKGLPARFPIDIGRAELSVEESGAELEKYAAAGRYTDEWGKNNPQQNIKAVFEEWED